MPCQKSLLVSFHSCTKLIADGSDRQPPYLIVRCSAQVCRLANGSTSNVNETIEHVQQTLESFIHSLNFTLSSFDNSPKSSPYHVTLSIPGGGRGERGLEPAPITSAEDPSFAFLAGTTKAVFGDDVIVAPTGMYGKLTGVTGRGWRSKANAQLTPTRADSGL